MSQAVIFDMDGTLFQTEKILELALEDTFQLMRSKGEWEGTTPIEQYREIMGVPLPEVWDTLLPAHSDELKRVVDAYFLERLVENIHAGSGALYPGVEDAMEFLVENQFSIYIASNGLRKYLHAIVQHYKLDRWVTETFSIEQIASPHKSDLVCEILKKHAITSGAVVGDRLSDIKAAKENALLAIGCHFDFAKEEEMVQADFVVYDLRDVKQVLFETMSIETR
ncbi:HAD hydrolase-like protein [Halobacillus salinus]|uniref:HAD family hydrolase n=1 Tax=Halobacillus salinus TaxID=192814 RepID=A0A4Z0H4R8_9BACI|nr:HAD hydrolase-like protein [Halobacillus salinus]TGB04877.1 HAD family hydrolase [Halobacillus salinus]